MFTWKVKDTWDRCYGHRKRYQCPCCDYWSNDDYPFCPHCGTRLKPYKILKKDYMPVLCTRGGREYESGIIYAAISSCNGVWVFRSRVDEEASHIVCHEYGEILCPPEDYPNQYDPMFEIIRDFEEIGNAYT